jgi:hypothetical protein
LLSRQGDLCVFNLPRSDISNPVSDSINHGFSSERKSGGGAQ